MLQIKANFQTPSKNFALHARNFNMAPFYTLRILVKFYAECALPEKFTKLSRAGKEKIKYSAYAWLE